jgi:hypothetical protein
MKVLKKFATDGQIDEVVRWADEFKSPLKELENNHIKTIQDQIKGCGTVVKKSRQICSNLTILQQRNSKRFPATTLLGTVSGEK